MRLADSRFCQRRRWFYDFPSVRHGTLKLQPVAPLRPGLLLILLGALKSVIFVCAKKYFSTRVTVQLGTITHAWTTVFT
jgi:hypothetical protein